MVTVFGRHGVWKVCGVAVLAALGAWSWPGSAGAQRITRWVDEQGRLHFTTSPPPPGVKYETLDLPVTRAVPARVSNAPAEKTEKVSPAAPSAGNGNARVVLEGKKTEAAGPSARAFRGKVKNVGGKPATDIFVRISVFEDGQGNDCLQDTLAVEPPSLGPGETGTYSAVLESPCFFGRPRIDLTPRFTETSGP